MSHVDHVEGLIKFVREAVIDQDDDQNPGLEDCTQAAMQHQALVSAARALIENGLAHVTLQQWNALRDAVAMTTSVPAAEPPKESEPEEYGDGPHTYNVKLSRSTSHKEVAWVTVHASDDEEAGDIALEHEHEVAWENDDAMDDLYNGDAEVDEVEEA